MSLTACLLNVNTVLKTALIIRRKNLTNMNKNCLQEYKFIINVTTNNSNHNILQNPVPNNYDLHIHPQISKAFAHHLAILVQHTCMSFIEHEKLRNIAPYMICRRDFSKIKKSLNVHKGGDHFRS